MIFQIEYLAFIYDFVMLVRLISKKSRALKESTQHIFVRVPTEFVLIKEKRKCYEMLDFGGRLCDTPIPLD